MGAKEGKKREGTKVKEKMEAEKTASGSPTCMQLRHVARDELRLVSRSSLCARVCISCEATRHLWLRFFFLSSARLERQWRLKVREAEGIRIRIRKRRKHEIEREGDGSFYLLLLLRHNSVFCRRRRDQPHLQRHEAAQHRVGGCRGRTACLRRCVAQFNTRVSLILALHVKR